MQYSLGENEPNTILKSLATRLCKVINKSCGEVSECSDRELNRNGVMTICTYNATSQYWDEWEMTAEFDSGDLVVRIGNDLLPYKLKLRVSDTDGFMPFVRLAAVQIFTWFKDVGAVRGSVKE